MQGQFNNVGPQLQSVTQAVTQTQEQNFWSHLSSAVPNWQEVNNNPDFHTWLLTHDRLTGVTRQTYLDHAHRALDAGRVAAIFEEWIGQAGNSQAPVPPASKQEALEKHVSPGKSRGGSPGQVDKPRTYTPADIQKFYTDVAQGKYRGEPEKRARIESDIFAAQREGRIT